MEVLESKVCGNETFWNNNVSWNVDVPHLTKCFRSAVFSIGPCALFWVFFSVEFIRFHRTLLSNLDRRRPICPLLVVAKTLIILFLLIILLIDFVNYNVIESQFILVFDVIIRAVTFVCVGLLGLLPFRDGFRQFTGPQWIFWLTYVCCTCFNLYIALDNEIGTLPLTTAILSLFLSVAGFLCNFFVLAPSHVDADECPQMNASYPSLLTFSWFNGLIWKGFRKQSSSLIMKDIWTLMPEFTAGVVVPTFEQKRRKSRKFRQNSKRNAIVFNKLNDDLSVNMSNKKSFETLGIFSSLIFTNWRSLMSGIIFKLVHDLLMFLMPLLLRRIIEFTSDTNEPLWHGILYSLALFFIATLQSLALSKYFYCMYTIGMKIRTSVTSVIYRKSMVVANRSSTQNDTSVGQVVNLMSVDTQRIIDMMPYINMLWSGPLQIILALLMLYQTLGVAVFAGLGVMIFLIPVNSFIGAKVKTLQIKQMKEKDDRVKKMNEIIQGIKILKLYAWEPSFLDLIIKIRNREISILTKMSYLQSVSSFVSNCAPFFVSLVTFMCYVMISSENILDASKAFVSLSLFNVLRFPLFMLPTMLSNLVQASVSIKRINKYMDCQEIDTSRIQRYSKNENAIHSLILDNCSFCWKFNVSVDRFKETRKCHEEPGSLKNISLSVERGTLLAIIGVTGSGKSSLLSAILGEMEMTAASAKCSIYGSVAYTSQIAWIQNCSVKENILFGRQYDETRYQKAIHDCALETDIARMPIGDMTEIGEKGINLSGGQKQRISLARAVYADADIYLLDDPLSAVDAHVGKHIFENVIGPNGCLAGKTRLLVTHSISFLPLMNMIVMMKDGSIAEKGTYRQLLELKRGFAAYLLHFTSQSDIIINEIGKDVITDLKSHENDDAGLQEHMDRLRQISVLHNASKSISITKNVQQKSNELDAKYGENHVDPKKRQYMEEKMEAGSVKYNVYSYYARSMGLTIAALCFLNFLLFQVCSFGSSIWLSRWSDQASSMLANSTSSEYKRQERDFYLVIYGGLGFGQAFAAITGTIFLFKATLNSARLLHNNMLKNIMRSPMSFFEATPQGRIINRFGKDVDVLDNTMPMIIKDWLNCLMKVAATLGIITYTTPIFIVPILFIMLVYIFVQRVFVATSRQLKRLESVSRSPIFSHFNETLDGVSTIRAFRLQQQFMTESERRIDFHQQAAFASIVANRWLAIRLESIGNILIFAATLLAVYGRENLTPGLVGLSISYAISITQVLNWLVRMTSEMETNIVSAERIKEYTETPTEADWILPEVNQLVPNWPLKGEIEFENYFLRYRADLNPVLYALSCIVESGERLGIVGRTGAGKSSLTMGLFRIIEAEKGRILIDGIDISSIGLHTLRQRITIIPQDPVLFSGTLRSNLDPFGTYNESELWSAVKHSHLQSFISSLPLGLDHVVVEGGENISVGQRQLLCLARALLRRTKILILDEATASVDLETDELIQSTLNTEFASCTILTIAHRLKTILDYDKVLVLEDGKKVEFDTPMVLMQNHTTIFYSMCQDAGLI